MEQSGSTALSSSEALILSFQVGAEIPPLRENKNQEVIIESIVLQGIGVNGLQVNGTDSTDADAAVKTIATAYPEGITSVPHLVLFRTNLSTPSTTG